MMGLYLAVFDDDVELDGVEVGSYADFAALRDAVVTHCENGKPGSVFPTFSLHSDCDGEWTPGDSRALERELLTMSARFKQLPPVPLTVDWKIEAANLFGLQPRNLYGCFFDVDGEPLFERLIGLARLSQSKQLPILFQ